MKNFKKFTAFVLALCMVFSLSVAAFAAESDEHTVYESAPEEEITVQSAEAATSGTIPGSSIKWSLDSKGWLTISGSGEAPVFTSADDQPWAAVRDQITEAWFEDVETLTIPDLAYWFEGCVNLTTAELPLAPTIGRHAFYNCPKISTLTMYYGETVLNSIGEDAFWRETDSGDTLYIAYIIGTYAMALGVLNGYMGIQMNGYTADGSPRHDVLFSMWDDGSTDEDPNLPEYLRAGAVDWDPLTTTNRFGNEGTGVQTYRKGPYWTPGKYVQFITNCRPETTSYTTEVNGKPTVHTQHNMLVSAWFNALDGKGWQYMATVRKRNSTTYFDAWYSFLENYNASTGQANRIAYYRNGYMRARSNGKWYYRNSVGFGHTDGGDNTGARTDYGQGTTDNPADRTFFMQTGGYTSTNKTKTTVALATDYTPVDTINITPLNDRVLTAIANEKARIEKEQLFVDNLMDKTGWEAIEYSSEETAGEGTNGRAQQTVDSDDDTYWHPQWYGSTAQLPHYIVVDMKDVKNVGGFEIKMGDNANRHIKAYDIYGSTDNANWTLLCSDDNAPSKSSFLVILDKAADIRYFKIVVRQTTATDGPFLRIYEMNVASGAVATAVNHITANNGTSPDNNTIYNISGQKIGEDAKGIVISNGRKYIRK